MTDRVEYALFDTQDKYDAPTSAKQLVCDVCNKRHAILLVEAWHSRLPKCQPGPWQRAFKMSYQGTTYAVALFNNPSARTLPGHWVELRRMACAPDAPKFTASRFLSQMVRWYKQNEPEHERMISYQDMEVHTGTIYKAANWHIGHIQPPTIRDRSKKRRGTNSMYRTSINGRDADIAGKVRWEIGVG